MAKICITLSKTWEFDTTRASDKNFFDGLIFYFQGGSEYGTKDADEIHDAIGVLLEEDMESVIDPSDISEMDFQIDVDNSMTLEVPKEEEDKE